MTSNDSQHSRTHQPPPTTPTLSNLSTHLLFPTLSTYNLTSSSNYSAQRFTKANTIKRISLAHTVSFWQETRLAALDDGRLTAFHTSQRSRFLSNHPDNLSTNASLNKAGVAITIDNNYLNSFHNPRIHPLDPYLEGHALLIL